MGNGKRKLFKDYIRSGIVFLLALIMVCQNTLFAFAQIEYLADAADAGNNVETAEMTDLLSVGTEEAAEVSIEELKDEDLLSEETGEDAAVGGEELKDEDLLSEETGEDTAVGGEELQITDSADSEEGSEKQEDTSDGQVVMDDVGIESEPASDGAVAVIFGDLPEEAEAVIETVSFTEEELFELFGEKASAMGYCNAYDIRIMVDGEEWQPDGKVSVIVREPDLTVSENEKLTVTHIDSETGDTTCVDAEITEVGEISFEAEGFSVYIFSVEFLYDGLTYSIAGESSILLSELFEKLSIDRNVADVESVEFSNDELIGIMEENGDWLLTSLQAFSTEETLCITFKGGEKITVIVTDDQYPTLDGDYAYIKSLTVASIEDGVGNFDRADNIIAEALDGTGAVQTVESPGNDASNDNGKVRTYDSIIYYLDYVLDTHQRGDSVKEATAYFRFVLPLTAKQAEWDTDSMLWMQNIKITEEEIGGKNCQVLTGKRLLVPAEGNTNVIPGSGTWRAAVKVLQMHNGDTVTPTFSAWLEGNCTDGTCSEHSINEVVTASGVTSVTVTCAPKYNVQLQHSATIYVNGSGEYDFTTGNEFAFDKDAGKVTGRASAFGITLQLYNDRPDKGLMGLEFPSGDITFDLDLATGYVPGGGTETVVTEDFAPLIWGWGPQNTGASDSHKDNGGRTMMINGNTGTAMGAAPNNSGGDEVGTNGSVYCKNGGTWSATKEGNTIHFKVSDYEIDAKCFPNANSGNSSTADVYYNPKPSGYKGIKNQACFSAAKLFVVIPFYDKNGKHVTEKYNPSGVTDGNFVLYLEDKNLKAEGIQTSTGNANQMWQSDDKINANLSATIAKGDFDQLILWSRTANNMNKDAMGGATCISNGLDWTLPRTDLVINWGFTNRPYGESENWLIAVRSLMKFDPAVADLSGEYSVGVASTTQSQKVFFAAKPDGTTWESDAEMNKTKMEELLYYETLDELETAGKICVGALYEVDPIVEVDKVDDTLNKTNAYPNVCVKFKVRDDAARDGTYMCTAETRVWKLKAYHENPELSVPSLLDNDPAKPIELPKPSEKTTPAENFYPKVVYKSDGTYEGHRGNRAYGDSLLVMGITASVQVKTVQTSVTPGGDPEPKKTYDLDYFQRTVDYGIYPKLTVPTGGNGVEGTASGTTTVTIQDILPKGLRYISGSAYYGGTYTENALSGRQGTVTDGQQMEPEISVDPTTGEQTLTWIIENVPVGGDMPPIYFSAALGTPNDASTDVKNDDRLMNTATIRTSKDPRAISAANKNMSQTEIMVSKMTASALSKVADEKYVEAKKNGVIGYTLTQSNNSASNSDFIVMDTLPYNGDNFGSSFTDTYTVEEFKIDETADNIRNWKVYYTTDAAARGTTAANYTKDAIEDEWTSAAIGDDGIVSDLKGKTPTAIATICTITGGKQFKAHLSLKKDLTENEKFVNVVSNDMKNMTIAEVDVISRALEGCLWIDANKNGARDDNEVLPGGVKVTLLKWNTEKEKYEPVLLEGSPVTCMLGKVKNIQTGAETTGDDGHYRFTGLSAGTFAVRFEGTEAFDFRLYSSTEKEKTGVEEWFNSNAYGHYEEGILKYTQIDGIVMKTKKQILEEGVTRTQISRYNDSGLCLLKGGLTVSKTVKPDCYDPEKAFAFTVTLGDTSIDGTFGDMTFKSGVAKFTLKDGESKSAEGIPAEITYIVEEDDYSTSGYTASSEGAEGTINAGTDTKASFTNTYKAAGTSVTFGGTKTFNGFPAEVSKPEFEITLSEGKNVIRTATVSAGAYAFESITYTEPGEHIYVIAETDGKLPGVTYDTKKYTVKVTVTDNGDGQLTATISGGSTTGTDLNFTNTYKAANATVTFSGTKTFTGFPETVVDKPEFTITLSENSELIDSVKVKSGAYAFKEIAYTEPGVHNYVISETDGKVAGITYDTKTYNVKVTVADPGDGQLTATISGGSTTGTDLNFTNSYKAANATVTFSGTKTFTEFPETCEITQVFTVTLSEEKNVIRTATVSAGAYAFENITYTEPGEHTYVIAETDDKLPGVTYDTKKYTVKVTVTDNGSGQLEAAISGDSTTGQDLNFTNRYKAEPVSIQLSGLKTLTGRTLATQEFSFTLTGKEDGVNETVKNAADGRILFSKITYTEPGTYTYTVKEEETRKVGVTSDSKVYNLTVTVTDNGSGRLMAAISGDSTTGKNLNFVNVYKFTGGGNEGSGGSSSSGSRTTESTGSLSVSKTVTGDLGDQTKAFSFVVELSASGRYSYTGSSAGTVASGETIWLRHGDRIVISGLPSGTAYKVTEVNYGDYLVYAQGNAGVIAADSISEASFVNTRSSVPKTGDSSNFRWWLALTGLCLFGLLGTLTGGRKKRRKEKAE